MIMPPLLKKAIVLEPENRRANEVLVAKNNSLMAYPFMPLIPEGDQNAD